MSDPLRGAPDDRDATTKTRDWIRRRAIVLVPAGLFLAVMLLLRVLPHWPFFFEALRVWKFWVLPVLLCAGAFSVRGFRYHRKTGLPLFVPFAASLSVVMIVGVCAWFLTDWSVDWSVWFCALALGILLGSAILLVIGLTAYAELWRRFLNSSVVEAVRRLLADGRFGRYLREPRRSTDSRPGAASRGGTPTEKRWGSLHCLRVIRGHYDDTKLAVLRPNRAEEFPAKLSAYYDAGNTLVAYLLLDWPEGPHCPRNRFWQIAEVRREMLETYFWVTRLWPHDPTRDDLAPLRSWEREFRTHAERVSEPYTRMMTTLFELRMRQHTWIDAAETDHQANVRRVMHRILEHFRAVVEDRSRLPVLGDVCCDLCASAWLALAPAGLDSQSCFDVWMAMREIQQAELFVPPSRGDAVDGGCFAAQIRLAELYEALCARTPPDWSRGLAGRLRHALELKPHEALEYDVWPAVREDTRRTSSWPYPEVWRCVPVRGLMGVLSATTLVVLVVALAAVNPRMIFNRGGNTIDHVVDRRLGPDDASVQFKAMAASEHWVAMATSDNGLRLMRKESRVGRDRVTSSPVLDVSPGPEPDSFLVLDENQGISEVRASSVLGLGASEREWLPVPPNLVWPTSEPQARSPILANDLDEQGWMVAVQGRGIARYRLGLMSDGRRFRERSWQLTSLSDVPLGRLTMTSDALWMSLAGGGIRCADRTTLEEIPRRRTDTPPVVLLDAGYTGGWAVAVDRDAGLWVYPQADTGWRGPFLGLPSGQTRLKAARDVKVARLDSDVAWLGTPYGMFAYNIDRRRMSCVVPRTDVSAVFPLVRDGSSSRGASALVAGSGGLHLVGLRQTGVDFDSTPLDGEAVTGISVSPDTRFCIYRVRGESGAGEVRAVRAPFAGGALSVVVSGRGLLPAPAKQPVIHEIEIVGDRLLFGTSEGAFFYDEGRHAYEDCSQARFAYTKDNVFHEETRVMRDFEVIVRGDQRLLAVAEGKPLERPLQDADGPTIWRSLDPLLVTRPRQIVECADRILGFSTDGRIHWYRPGTSTPTDYCSGRAPSLVSHPLEDGHAAGDVLFDRERNTYRLTLLNGKRLCTYNSTDGVMAETDFPVRDSDDVTLSQVRLAADGSLLALLSDGRVVTTRQNVVTGTFASGGLPFIPTRTTAIAPGHKPSQVLVAGPEGRLLSYDWRDASWKHVGAGSVPMILPGQSITAIHPAGDSMFVQSSDDRVFYAMKDRWLHLEGYRRAAFDGRGLTGWFLAKDGVDRLRPDPDKPVVEWEVSRFCRGTDLRKFMGDTAFAWQDGTSRVVLFSHGPEAGVYDASTETWQTLRLDGLTRPGQFVVGDGCIVMLDGGNVVRLGRDLRPVTLYSLPPGVGSASLQLSGRRLQVAFVHDRAVALRVWEDVQEGGVSQVYRSEEALNPDDLDVERVACAEADDKGIVLMDDRGACARYEPGAGRWSRLRTATPGEEVHGWLTVGRKGEKVFLLETGRRTTALVTLCDGVIGVLPELQVMPADVPRSYQAEAASLRERAKGGTDAAGALKLASVWDGAASWHLANLVRPVDGTVLKTPQVEIVRLGARARYRVFHDGVWQPHRTGPGGFEADVVKRVAFSASGQLWALHGEKLARLTPKPATGTLLLTPPVPALAGGVADIETTSTGHVRVEYAAGHSTLLTENRSGALEAVAAVAPRTLAGLDFAQHRLTWTVDVDGKLDVSWATTSGAAPQPTLWGSSGGRLALQCVRDLAQPSGDDLLLATEAGVAVRNPRDFTLKALHLLSGSVSFLDLPGRKGLLLVVNGVPAFEWRDGRLVPLPVHDWSDAVGTVTSGVWQWRLRHMGPSSVRLEIVRPDSSQSRPWHQVSDGTWKFDDDVVNWIGRSEKDKQLWLATRCGLWPYGAATGRDETTPDLLQGKTVLRTLCPESGAWWWMGGPREWRTFDASGQSGLTPQGAPPAEAETRFQNPALTVSSSAGTLRFTPFDGRDRTVFDNGRFFTDNPAQMCAWKGAVYFLIRNRCIVRRDRLSPATVTGCWSLPPDLRDDPTVLLTATAAGLRLETRSSGDETRRLVFDLDPDAAQPAWRRSFVGPRHVRTGKGLIAWYPPPDEQRQLVPYWIGGSPAHPATATGTPGRIPITGWWNGDRFTWDRVHAVGALDGKSAVLVTPLGPFVSTVDLEGTSRTIAFWPKDGLDFCREGWKDERFAGLIVGGTGHLRRWLVTADAEGVPTISECTGAGPTMRRAMLSLAYRDGGASVDRRHIGFIESWMTLEPSGASGDPPLPALSSALSRLPADDMLHDGRFVFDHVTGACQLNSKGDRWITVVDAPASGMSKGWMCLNEVRPAADSRRDALVLLDLWRADGGSRYVRPAGSSAVYLAGSPTPAAPAGAWSVRKATFTSGETLWEDAGTGGTGTAFWTGEKVTLDLDGMQWSSAPLHVWDTVSSPLEVRSDSLPQGAPLYPLFVEHGKGIALGFDVLTSLTMAKDGQTVALGTKGGVIVTRYRPDGRHAMADSSARLAAAGNGEWMPGVVRIRYDRQQVLHGLFGPEPRRAVLDSGHLWTQDLREWPATHVVHRGLPIAASRAGIEIQGRRHESTNDEWGGSRWILTDVGEIAADDADESVWLISRRGGLVKVLPAYLPGF